MDEEILLMIRFLVASLVKGAIIGYLTFLATHDFLFSFTIGFIYGIYDAINKIIESDYFKKLVERHRHGSEDGRVYYTSY